MSVKSNAIMVPENSILDNSHGGRRLGIDRRQFSYDFHIPERRSGKDQRSSKDRRQTQRISKHLKQFKRV